MKKIITTFIIVAAFATLSLAQNSTAVKSTTTENKVVTKTIIAPTDAKPNKHASCGTKAKAGAKACTTKKKSCCSKADAAKKED
jgi:hypothetical protein